MVKPFSVRIALGFFKFLDDDLLSGLCADSSDFVLAEGFAVDGGVNRSNATHDMDVDNGFFTKLTFCRSDQSRLDGLDDQFRVDLLFAMEGIDDTQQFLGIHAA
jgi:hypothetical protein